MNNGHKTIASALPVVAALVLAGSANGQCEPTILGSLDLPGEARDVAVSGAVAYVAAGSAGLLVIDVTSANPEQFRLLGQVRNPDLLPAEVRAR